MHLCQPIWPSYSHTTTSQNSKQQPAKKRIVLAAHSGSGLPVRMTLQPKLGKGPGSRIPGLYLSQGWISCDVNSGGGAGRGIGILTTYSYIMIFVYLYTIYVYISW